MRTIPEINLDSLTLYKQFFENINQGDEFSYKELNDSIGKDVQREARGNLRTAIKMALREKKMVIESVRGQGVKCLNDNEIPGIAIMVQKHIHKSALKGGKKLFCVKNVETLSDDDRTKLSLGQTLMNFYKQATSLKGTKLIEDKVTQTQKALPFNKTLEAFKKNGNEEVGNETPI